jgi:hypothetical protein
LKEIQRNFSYSSQVLELEDVVVVVGEYYYRNKTRWIEKRSNKRKRGEITLIHGSIMIDHVSNLSYISPQTLEKGKLYQERHAKPWLVQLAIRTKRKLTKVITTCQIIMNGMSIQATLNIFPLGSYDMLIGMDWLDSHKAKSECYDKTLECEDEEGKKKTLQGIQKPVSVRQISTLQMNKYCRKGCPWTYLY